MAIEMNVCGGRGNEEARYGRNLRLQTPVGGDEGKSSTGDERAHERTNEDCFETKLKINSLLNLKGTRPSYTVVTIARTTTPKTMISTTLSPR